MSRFWPRDFELSDTQSPFEILRDAQKDWDTNSGGLLALLFQRAKSQSGNDMIIVHAKHVPSNRTVTLFSVVHRANTPYPATIEPRGEDLPDFLKRSYHKGGMGGVSDVLIRGYTVKNEWVCDTPSEFRIKLEKVFNLGAIKSEILNLLCASSGVADDSDREPPTEADTEEDEPNG